MLSTILKQHRKARGLTQEQVAQALHIDRTTYAYYELGRSKPSITMAAQLANFYGVTLDALVGGGAEGGAAIDDAWDNTDPAVRERQRQLFPCGKPTPGEFIRVMAEQAKGQR